MTRVLGLSGLHITRRGRLTLTWSLLVLAWLLIGPAQYFPWNHGIG